MVRRYFWPCLATRGRRSSDRRIASLSFARARANRAFTVLLGIPRMRAASEIERPSTSLS
jgi:hypothetical protein